MSSDFLPRLEFVCEMQHKYAVGDKVRVIATSSKMCGRYGTIHTRLPYMLAFPGYDVRFGGEIVAFSEQSLEKIESLDSESI